MASKDSDMVATTNTPFRLLSLPPELWSRICRLAVTRQDRMEFSEAMSCGVVENIVKQPAITRVCKTIREETIDLFYANSFIFLDTSDTENNFWSWLRALCIGHRIRYSMPNLRIESHFDLEPANYCLSGTGLTVQRVGKEEPDSPELRSFYVYKIVHRQLLKRGHGLRSI
ncbi:hypothetical protein LTR56_011094 [Elasticomyces elasticus]|nr:hypothetical protein LTR56_011094 [Elasticomyces elasticus]KAK3662485.1 hypothetical protein LTR22_006764 [Elasticomyces elasticus]KAK4926474.1 hypothetical protein LTR49_006681 [Elasticomyces elasticus]KAK5761152.1 hypothetical protein LTS12_008633 [Elasticomyces elasticus]